MINVFIHEAPTRAASLRTRLTTALEALPAATAEPMISRLVPEERRVPTLVFTGHHSGGKSMLIKALTDGAANVLIDADIATDSVNSYSWDGAVTLVDTPGVHAGVEAHDEVALAALMGADLVLFVITPDLFDDLSAQHLRYVADGLGKRDQLMVVVNKAQTMTAYPGVRTAALAKVLGDGALPPLLECDAKHYVLSLTEQDKELAEHLRTTSGLDELRARINAFSAERGDLAMLCQPFQLIRSIAAEAESTLVEDPEEKAITSWLSRVRRALCQHERALAVDLTAERGEFLRGALDRAEVFADAVEFLDGHEESAWKGGFDAAAAELGEGMDALSDRTAGRMQDAVERVFHGLSGEVREIDGGPQAAFIRSFDDGPKKAPRRDARFNLRTHKARPASHARTTESMRQAQLLLGEFRSAWGAGEGVKASAGSVGHEVTKNLGSFLGKKWKPWESVRLANDIGRFARVAGVGLQVGLAVHEVYAEDQRAMQIERARVDRRRTIVNQVMAEAEAHIDRAIREIRTIVDKPFKQAYQVIDHQWNELAGSQGERSELRKELRAIQEECSRMTTKISGV